ncbi:hypothetical protein D3C81_1689240 [compost metagenome]
MLGVQHLVFPFFLQRGIGAIGADFAQSLLQTGLLVGIAAGFGQFDLIDDALFLGRATGQARGVFDSHQGSGHYAAKGQKDQRWKKFHKSSR